MSNLQPALHLVDTKKPSTTYRLSKASSLDANITKFTGVFLNTPHTHQLPQWKAGCWSRTTFSQRSRDICCKSSGRRAVENLRLSTETLALSQFNAVKDAPSCCVLGFLPVGRSCGVTILKFHHAAFGRKKSPLSFEVFY